MLKEGSNAKKLGDSLVLRKLGNCASYELRVNDRVGWELVKVGKNVKFGAAL